MDLLLLLILGGFSAAVVFSILRESHRNRAREKVRKRAAIERVQKAKEREAVLEAERLRLRGTGKVPFVDWERSFFETHTIRFRKPSPPRARPSGWSEKWDEEQLLRQEGCCFWCGEPLDGVAHRDHVDPLARGGPNDVCNLVMACPPCNLDKSASDPRKWIWTSSRVPDSRRALLESMIPSDRFRAIPEPTETQTDPTDLEEVIEFELQQRNLFDLQ